MENPIYYSFNDYILDGNNYKVFDINSHNFCGGDKANRLWLQWQKIGLQWQKKCLDFWNLFYSLLLIADQDLTLTNLNFLANFNSNNDIYLSGNIIEISQESSKTNLEQILAKTQQFKLKNEIYSFPQNFLWIEYKPKEKYISFYYPYLVKLKKDTTNNTSKMVIKIEQSKEINLSDFFSSNNQSKNFFKDINLLQQKIDSCNDISNYNVEDIFNIYLILVNQVSMNLTGTGIYFIQEISTLNNSLLTQTNNIQNISSQMIAALNYQDILRLKNNIPTNISMSGLSENSQIQSKNYLIYPLKNLRITQTYNGNTSHRRHLQNGNPIDYSIDEGGASGVNQEEIYCPCDELEVIKNYGVGNSGINTVWFKSTSPVLLANGTLDYITIEFIHSNDEDFEGGRLNKGKKFKRGDVLLHTGTDGGFDDHAHIAVGLGMPKDPDSCWTRKIVNGISVYVLDTIGGPIKPEDAFWIDKNFTKIIDTAGLNFKALAENIG